MLPRSYRRESSKEVPGVFGNSNKCPHGPDTAFEEIEDHSLINAALGYENIPFDTLFWLTIEINDYPNVWFARMVISEFTPHDLARIS